MKLSSPMRRWEVLAGIAQAIDARTFIEVGTKEGRTAAYLLHNLPDIRVTAIDPWAPVANTAEDYKDWDYAAIEAEFWRNVGEAKDRVTMLRTTSAEAAKGVPDGSAQLIFIDAAHDYAGCAEDIRLWLPKLAPGGYLCGHDYNHKWPGVHRAVAEAFNLIDVAVMPDSVWCVSPAPALEVAA